MTQSSRRILTGLSTFLMAFTLISAAQEMPRTSKESIPGQSSVKTEQVHGTVVYDQGQDLVVKMSNGQIREFHVPDSRKFMVDGRELTVDQLEPGTRLTATVTTTTTSVTDRTTTIGTGKVWFVSGNTVIITLPNNENRMYKVNESYRFIVNGQPASVHALRKGMVISAQRIVEEPRTEIATNTEVTGHAPPKPSPTVAATPAPRPRPAPARPAAVAPAPTPTPAAAPVEEKAEAAPPPALPKTASPLPLIGLLGLLFSGASLGLRGIRRG